MAMTMAGRPDAQTTEPGPAPGRLRAAGAVVALLFAYVGFLLGAPAPDVRPASAGFGLQATGAARHLAPRADAGAIAAAERADPKAAPPPSGRPAIGAQPAFLAGRRAVDRPPNRASSVRAAAVRRAHPPRAPPSVSA